MGKPDILVLVEGEVTDVELMERLFEIYGISEQHHIMYYGTSIYMLYDSIHDQMYRDVDGEPMLDIALYLRERETNPQKKADLSRRFSRILLIFDLDPGARDFSDEIIQNMTDYFNDVFGAGQLYINYPMVESFYHAKEIPDPDYFNYITPLVQLRAAKKRNRYKARVGRESCIHDRRAFFTDKAACNAIIRQNLEKAWFMVEGAAELLPPSQAAILQSQLDKLSATACIAVLCTCIFYILDYNPQLIL